MKKKIVVYLETDTDNTDVFIEHDIKQELNCCSCFYENIIVNIWNIEDEDRIINKITNNKYIIGI